VALSYVRPPNKYSTDLDDVDHAAAHAVMSDINSLETL